MNKIEKFDLVYLKIAKEVSNLSYCKRNKVGSIIVKNDNIISFGYNGTPAGFHNDCEDCNGNSNGFVIHAEMNAIIKASRSTYSIEDSTMYCTLSPCLECAKHILQAKISRLVYLEPYRNLEGLHFLEPHIKIIKYEI